MKMIHLLTLSTVLIGLFSGCGNSSEPSYTNETPKKGGQPPSNNPPKSVKTIIGHVIDSPIWGLEYSCEGQKTETTDKFGTFECEALPVTFKVGDLTIGHVSNMTDDKKIYPQDIIGVSRDKVEDSDVVELTRFFQTLDDDGNIDESIKIDPQTANKFKFKKSVDLTTLDEKAISSILQDKIGRELVDKEEAQKHLRENLVADKEPTGIELLLSAYDISKGLDGKVTVNGIYEIDDGEVKSIIADGITYSSSDTNIATVDASGKITALNEGTVEISAKHGDFEAKSDLRVTHTTLTRIEIANPVLAQLTDLALGRGTELKVKGFYSADSIEKDVTRQIVWSSKSPLFAGIDSDGYIRASGVGNTSLLATLFDITDKVEFEIKKSDIKRVKINLREVEIPLGTRIYFSDQMLLGYYEDDSNTSEDDSNESLMSIATLDVDKENILKIVKADHRNVYIEAKEKGSAILSAKYKGLEDNVTITVVDPIIESFNIDYRYYDFYVGDSFKVTVTGKYTDGTEEDITDKVIFKSLNPAIISIVSDGNVTGLKEGHGSFKVTYVGNDVNVTSVRSIYVQKPYVAPVPTSISILAGDSDEIALGSSKNLRIEVTYDNGQTDTYYNNDVSWEVNSSDIAKLNIDYDAYLEALKKGEVTVTAKLGELTTSKIFKVVGPTSIAITFGDSDEIPLGNSKNLSVKAIYSIGTERQVSSDDIYWEIDSDDIARLNARYSTTLYTLKKGEVTVTAKYDELTISKTFTVVDPIFESISISSSNSEIFIGKSQQFKLIARYSDNSQKDIEDGVTWMIMSDVATVTEDGNVTGVKVGSTRLKATYGDKSTTTSINVQKVKVFHINALDSDITLDVNDTAQLKVQGHYNDGTEKEITENLTWKSDDESVATVDGSGIVTGKSLGYTNITVEYSGESEHLHDRYVFLISVN